MEPQNKPRPAQAGSAKRGRPRRQDTTTVSFRVDGARLRALARGASEIGVSPHEYARILTYRILDRQEEVQFAEEVAVARREIASLRNDLAASLEVILANTTRAEAPQIRAWIDANLRHR